MLFILAIESLAMPGLELWFGWMLAVIMGGDGRVGVGVGVGVPINPRPLRFGKPAATEGGRFGINGI